MRTIYGIAGLLLLVATAVPATGSGPEPSGHPSLLPVVDPDADGPRFTAQDLARHGFPDHQHHYFWPGWTPPLDAEGNEYGFGSMCSGVVSKGRADLSEEPGRVELGRFSLGFRDDAEPCFVAPFLGLCEMAELDLDRVLRLEPLGRLHIINADDVGSYTEATGYGVWRMFELTGDTCVVQPVGVLARRTLIGHVAWDMTARWALEGSDCARLPVWLKDGVASWFAELGVHFVNYMAQPRLEQEEILLDPAAVEAFLLTPPLEDLGRDRIEYRKARYNAFLMVWRLVENHGGVRTLREFLHAVRDGEPADAASRRLYGMDLAGIARELDPRRHGEPLGDAVEPRNPAKPPVAERP